MINGSYLFCFNAVIPLRHSPDDRSEIVSQVLFGETAILLDRKEQWLRIKCLHDQYEGWVDHKQFFQIEEQTLLNWQLESHRSLVEFLEINTSFGKFTLPKGVLIPKEKFYKINDFTLEINQYKPKENSIVQLAKHYLNAPYLWGGRTILGIDCSGFTQTIMHQLGQNIPRDASMQVNIGEKIDFKSCGPGDFAFFHNSSNKITHVGVIIENKKIIHASGRVRIDTLNQKGIFNEEINDLTHKLHSINRIIS